jgi:hypothetical protein
VKYFWILVAAVVVSGCTTEQLGGLAEGMRQGQQMNPVKNTSCVRVDDQIFCQTR